MLEPGCGSGLFIGLAPDTVRASCRFVGVEIDPVTADIAQALYPNAEIRPVGFETIRDPDGSFDVAVGNVPFGRYRLFDPLHNPDRFSIHNHFLVKALALTKPGGLLAAVTSRYTLDSRNPDARRALHNLGDLLAAVRLPNGAHHGVAGTEVVTDIVVFRRRHQRGQRRSCSGGNAPTSSTSTTTRFASTPASSPTMGLGRIAGTLRAARGLYSDGELMVDPPADGLEACALGNGPRGRTPHRRQLRPDPTGHRHPIGLHAR